MRNSHNIPWKRISIEAATIVGSILLAFAIDAWWNNRLVSVEEEAILTSLRLETQTVIQSLDETMIYVSAIKASTQRMIRASVDTENEISDDEIDGFFNDVLWHIDPAVMSAPVIESLVNSGDMAIISNGELRRLLGSFMINWAGFRAAMRLESEYYNHTLIPYVQKHTSMAQLYSLESYWPGDPDRAYPPFDMVALKSTISHREILESRELQNILLHRNMTMAGILAWRKSDIRQQLQTIIGLIEHELED